MDTPLTAKEYLSRALAHDQAGRETQAIPDYVQALKLGLDPADERVALICLASSYRNVGETAQAETVINRARREFRDDPVVDAFAALIFLDADRTRFAVRILGLALCNHARPGALDGFESVLKQKFQAVFTWETL